MIQVYGASFAFDKSLLESAARAHTTPLRPAGGGMDKIQRVQDDLHEVHTTAAPALMKRHIFSPRRHGR